MGWVRKCLMEMSAEHWQLEPLIYLKSRWETLSLICFKCVTSHFWRDISFIYLLLWAGFLFHYQNNQFHKKEFMVLCPFLSPAQILKPTPSPLALFWNLSAIFMLWLFFFFLTLNFWASNSCHLGEISPFAPSLAFPGESSFVAWTELLFLVLSRPVSSGTQERPVCSPSYTLP